MSSELPADENGNSNVEEPSFITSFQFTALTEHYENVLESIKQEEGLKRIRVELLKLLCIFKSCYAESDRKTHKILELKAMNAVELQKVKSANSRQEEIVKDLKGTIRILQRDLARANDQRRELLEEIEETKDLKKDVETENKFTQVHSEFLETTPRDRSVRVFTSDGFKMDDSDKVKFKSSDKRDLVEKLGRKEQNEVTDVKVLKNNLDILVADLKLARKNVEDLKMDVRGRDVLIKKYNKDLSSSEAMLTEARMQITEIGKPTMLELKRCKTKLEKKEREFENLSKRLQVALDLNLKFSKDITLNGSVIDSLKVKMEELSSEKETIARKADMFENNSAENQVKIKALEQEIQTLKEKTMELEKKTAVVETASDTSRAKKERMEINAQERFVESLKNQIALQEKRLFEVKEELTTTIEILQSLRKDFTAISRDKVALGYEIEDVKKNLKEKIAEVQLLTVNLNEHRRGTEAMRKELYTCTEKFKQIFEKKTKFHNLYNHMKLMKSQRENENVILAKRQQYLVKILKDKDKEIEGLVSWKRYII